MTRHNAGRAAVERFAQSEHLSFVRKRELRASLAYGTRDDRPFVLACPDTFMNLSGEAVGRLVGSLSVRAEKDLLIVVDDLALGFGNLRLRGQGSDGGHHGLKSVQQVLESTRYARLRLGIGHPSDDEQFSQWPVESYVLANFTKKEQKELPALWEQAALAFRLWLEKPMAQAMDAINSHRKKG